MYFQNQISSGAEITVGFKIINPYDNSDVGFTLTTTASGVINLPIYIQKYSSTLYYLEQEPFHPFYKATSNGAAYPSMGISSVTVTTGTQAQGAFNYLQFVITLTRNDINGLVLEIPVISEDGTEIYNNPQLLGLTSGSKYPCSMGVYAPVYCYYMIGSSTNYGTPTRIYITKFNIPANNSLSFRMLFTNPDISDVFPKFIFKAFGGTVSPPTLMGSQLQGMFTLVDPFKIYSSQSYFSTASNTLTCYPTKILWQTGTQYYCYCPDQYQYAGNYAIIRWPMVDSTYGTITDYDNSANLHYDVFFVQTGLNQMWAYFVLKLGGTFTPSGSSAYIFGNLRMKHHIVGTNFKLYLLGVSGLSSSKLYNCNLPTSSWMWNTRSASNGFGQFTVDTIDVQKRQANAWTWHFFSINTIDADTIAFNGN